jgi:ABC-type polysaccharide/polyol phosphate export permease
MRSRSPIAAAVGDITEGVRLSPVWWRLGLEQTYNRYRRTLLGPFWIAGATISTGLSLAFVFGSLLGGDFRQSLPHNVGGIMCWSLVIGVVMDGTGLFAGSAGMMQVQRLPLSFYVLLSANRVIINFLHQILAFWALMAVFRLLTVPHWSVLLAIPVVTAAGFFLAIPIAMVSARYRDVGFLLTNVFGALFLLTPVFWTRAQLPPSRSWIVDYNPFAHLVEILRQPFLGQSAPLANWYASLGVVAGAALIAVISLAAFRKRVIFWL